MKMKYTYSTHQTISKGALRTSAKKYPVSIYKVTEANSINKLTFVLPVPVTAEKKIKPTLKNIMAPETT